MTINDQKMSKSLNNSLVISDFIKRYSVQELRFWIAKNLWRSPINYSDATMIEVRGALEKIEEFLRKIKNVKNPEGVDKKIGIIVKKAKEKFYQDLNDDFNTPKAFAIFFDMIKNVNKALDKNSVGKKDAGDIYAFFKEINNIFNIIDIKRLGKSMIPDQVKKLMEERQQARKNQDWPKSDELRLEIEKYGYVLQDSPQGSILKKK